MIEPKLCGKIDIMLGCMYSGKTTEVIRTCEKMSVVMDNVVCINYAGDTRYGDDDNLYSHNLKKISCIKAETLSEIPLDIIKNADMILINEAQFFPDLIDNCLLWAETYGKNIIASGLDGDFKRKPFGQILDLIPYADSVTKFSALCPICKDGTKAIFTKRLSDETEQKVIGSSNYMAVCRKHYN